MGWQAEADWIYIFQAMNAIQAFKTRALTGSESLLGSILEALTARPHALTILGREIEAVKAQAEALGGIIASLSTVSGYNGQYRAIFAWSNDFAGCDGVGSTGRVAPVAGEGLGLSADALEGSQVQSLPPRPKLTRGSWVYGRATVTEVSPSNQQGAWSPQKVGSNPTPATISEPTTKTNEISNPLVVPEPSPIESSLASIQQAMARNRRDRELRRRFFKLPTP